ncbi:hypothetical protein HHK36_017435 [Tetracentron sinense]|uniref:Uncharacterized protein n=1 Tax=Tetracentron sinense TaxID=13715 RepID=A0A835DCU6_TETSI|nr:hypothetical protein HHK36_017435 [Tetracentron sinense]
MQTGKNAAASVKETASNIAASAKSGMDKTKATVQGKVERVTAHNPMEKDMATQHKQEKMNQAEMNKQEAREHNAAAKHTNAAGGTTGHSVGLHHTPAIPGQGYLKAMMDQAVYAVTGQVRTLLPACDVAISGLGWITVEPISKAPEISDSRSSEENIGELHLAVHVP